MSKKKTLSKVMQECIDKLKLHGELIRYKGGFWSRKNCNMKYNSFLDANQPEWFFLESTINALIKRDKVIATDFNTYNQVMTPSAVKLKQ